MAELKGDPSTAGLRDSGVRLEQALQLGSLRWNLGSALL